MPLRFDFKSSVLPASTLTFDEPLRIIAAHSFADVLPALEQVLAAAEEGQWAAGYVAYEAASAFDGAMHTHPNNADRLPLVWFGIYSCAGNPGEGQGSRGAGAGALDERTTRIKWRPGIERDEYNATVGALRQAIGSGELYQANYTFPLTTDYTGDAHGLYLELLRASRCGYGAYLDLGRWCIVSVSPELFFEFDRRTRQVVTRPMKGTRARGRWTEEDRSACDALGGSEKDRAENVMIVDLLRNDLGRVAKNGSVRTPALFQVEQYPTVWQMTSTITAEARPDVNFVNLLEALFPCGSVTGAPKIAAMRKITEIENGPRGVYCGAIGLIRPGGSAVFSVAIRTLTIDREHNQATYPVGGGITWESTAEGEYAEALIKARTVSEIEPEFDLLETLRLESGEYYLLPRHIDRLMKSALYFQRPVRRNDIEDALNALAEASPTGAWRVRLLVDQEGRIRTEQSRLDRATFDSPQTYRLGQHLVSSKNPFLFHKTTNRGVYARAAGYTEGVFDVLLQNERGELTEFTRGNLVIELADKMLTPPRECGLLAGTLRDELISSGRLAECAGITVQMLALATRVWFVNSVHGWVEMRPEAV